jgi:capsular exopolysaccharide synthesis family protein
MTKLIVERNPKSTVSEAFRTLRTNIQFSSFDQNMQVILITSSKPGEGKSTISCNLALTLAQSDKKVLLIDCDLRKPTVHKNFRISNIVGLSNVLAEELVPETVFSPFLQNDVVDKEELARPEDSNLFILTSGTIPPNPAEMLSSRKMKAFINEMKKKFDYIILDTPPVTLVTDAQVLSTMADGVLIVISSMEADRELAKRAKELLVQVNAKIIGAVLNKVEIKKHRDMGYYAYYGETSKVTV